MDKPETADWYDRIYLEAPERWTSPERDEMLVGVLSGRPAPSTVLDIGCGNGHTLLRLAEEYPAAQLTGIDLSREAVLLAEQRVPTASLLAGDMLELERSLGSFDLIVMLGVLEHIESPEPALLRLRHHLRPRGAMYVEVPNCLAYSNPLWGEGFRRLSRGSRQLEWHLRRDTWEATIARAGLDVVIWHKGPRPECEFVWLLEASDGC